MSTEIMMRLGLQLVGSNADLAPVRDEKDDPTDGGGEGEGENTEDTEDTEDTDSDASGGEGEDASDEDGEEADDTDGAGSSDDEDDTDADDEDGEDGAGSSDDEDGDTEADDEDGDTEADDEGDASDGESESDDAGDGADAGDEESSESSSDAGDDASDAAGDDEASGEGGVGSTDDDFGSSILDGLEADDLGVKSSNEALKEGVKDCRDENVLPNEMVWRPFTTSGDKVVKPTVSPEAEVKAAKAQKAVSKIVAALRAQFRNKYLRARTPEVKHGVRRGQDLSERRLVDSMVEIRSGVAPSRPFVKMKKADDESLAVAVVGDESGSMHGERAKNAALAMLAVAEAFDSLGSPIMCCGIRDGESYHYASDGVVDTGTQFHRNQSVTVDLFKDWDEPLRTCRARFAGYRATGGTPLSDGIQYALEAMSRRQEQHRIIIVMTDGQPSDGPVVARQIRLAKEAGITIVGIGIGYGTEFVSDLFDTGIVIYNLNDLPLTLVKTVDGIVFPKQGGKKVALDASTGLVSKRF